MEDEVILLQNSGLAAPISPPAVPGNGPANPPLKVTKLDPAQGTVAVYWDTRTCPEAGDYHIIYGGGSQFPASSGGVYGIGGSRCGIGNTSPFTWRTTPDPRADPSGLLWWLAVAQDGATTEGSWGTDWNDVERQGPVGGASGECGITTKDVGNRCGL